ncbi:hypothetical protein MTO96_038419 [Rhipicephalus appendiculatus]
MQLRQEEKGRRTCAAAAKMKRRRRWAPSARALAVPNLWKTRRITHKNRSGPEPGTRKIDAIEEMVNKLTNKTERMFETLLTRLNESDVQTNAQYETINAQLAAVNKRIEDLERGTVQLQQQQRHEPGGAGLPLPHVVNVPTILNRGRNANATHTEAKWAARTVASPPKTFE